MKEGCKEYLRPTLKPIAPVPSPSPITVLKPMSMENTPLLQHHNPISDLQDTSNPNQATSIHKRGGDTLNPNQITKYLQMGGDTSNPSQVTQHLQIWGNTSNPSQVTQHLQIRGDISNPKIPILMTQ